LRCNIIWQVHFLPRQVMGLRKLTLVAHACNPSYSGGRDQKDHGLKLAWANSSWDPLLKKPFTKKGWWSGSRCRPWVQDPVLQKKKISFFIFLTMPILSGILILIYHKPLLFYIVSIFDPHPYFHCFLSFLCFQLYYLTILHLSKELPLVFPLAQVLFFVVLGLELRGFILSHSFSSIFFVKGFSS
jgi:hypothetical protein